MVAPSGLSGRIAPMVKARLVEVSLPEFGMPDVRPEIPPKLYEARVERLRERAESAGFDRVVVYADREHSANLAYLTGQGIRPRSWCTEATSPWPRTPKAPMTPA